MLNGKITILKRKLIEYASFVENMIDKSMKGLQTKDQELLHHIIEKDENRVNDIELELDKFCTTLIARYQPKASDLRTILMSLKMVSDLERIGDLAVNICESGLFLIARPDVKPLKDIPKIANEAAKMMLKESITAFVNQDSTLAKKVCARDNIVDDLKDKIIKDLVVIMVEDGSTIERCLHLIRIAQNLERIADLSTNICEEVIFITEGRVIKHHKYDGNQGC